MSDETEEHLRRENDRLRERVWNFVTTILAPALMTAQIGVLGLLWTQIESHDDRIGIQELRSARVDANSYSANDALRDQAVNNQIHAAFDQENALQQQILDEIRRRVEILEARNR